jgi:uncharacterized protein YbaR (Trm112 family)
VREFLREHLVCPICHGELRWEVGKYSPARSGDILEAGASCVTCGAAYPVKEGIAAFLTPDLYRDDLWEAMESRLSSFLRENPEIERKLLLGPLDSLSPADRLFRSLVLTERGDYEGGRLAMEGARGIYTPEYRAGQESQIEYVVDLVSSEPGPIFDLASGKAALVEPSLKRSPGRPLVVTDFSPRVLRSDKAYFDYAGIAEDLDFLAFDVRRMPFRDGSVSTFITHAGLQNIRDARPAVQEIRRVLKGQLFATAIFLPEGDPDTDKLLREHGPVETIYMRNLVGLFSECRMDVSVENLVRARALPTPKSDLVGGAEIDGLPFKEMVVDCCTLVARRKDLTSPAPG